jgi:hypothetical protein
MNELYRLPKSQHRAAVAHALPHLSLVRGKIHPVHRDDAGTAEGRAQQDAHQGACGLAGHGTQLAGDTAPSGWGGSAACADWPGRARGIRAPEAGETTLSISEVLHALNIKLIADDNDEIDKWPAVRVYRAAGTWGSRSRIAPRARWFDAVVTA